MLKADGSGFSKAQIEAQVPEFPEIFRTFLVRGTRERPDGMVSRQHYGILPAGKATMCPVDMLPVKGSRANRAASKPIQFARVKANWNQKQTPKVGVNIFGTNEPNAEGEFVTGIFTLDSDEALCALSVNDITEVRADELKSFDVTLLDNNESIAYSAKEKIFFNRYDYADNFVEDYVYSEQGSGGFFSEIHPDSPHWHTPMNLKSAGFIVYGRQIDEQTFDFAAFKVPYGYTAFSTGIHGDQHLTGAWSVAVTPDETNVRTVFWRNKKDEMVQVVTTDDNRVASLVRSVRL